MNQAAPDILSPLTGRPAQIIETMESAAFVEAWQRTLGIDIGDELAGIDQVHHCLCPLSRYEFFHPPAVAGSPKLYEQLGAFAWYYGEDKWEHRQVESALLHSAAHSVLEIGCGPGTFLKRLPKSLDAVGLETNTRAAAAGQAAGLHIETLDLDGFRDAHPGHRFDAVCSFQVLEHIPDPLPFLRGCLDRLEPGGTLYLSVPDGHGFHATIPTLDHIMDAPPHHVGRWNLATFQYLARVLPVELCHAAFEPMQTHHLKWYLKNLLATPTTTPPRGLRRAWHRVLGKLLYRHVRSTGIYRRWKGHTLLVGLRKTSDL